MNSNFTAWAGEDYSELFNPKPVGAPVNVHVHRVPAEPEPDYDAIKRMVEGADLKAPLPTEK